MRPIFLLSAPRAGSTLVQRVLAAHPRIHTVSEPWILLPLLSPLQRKLPAAGPREPLIADAVEDFCSTLPSGRDEYREAAREFALRLYATAAGTDDGYFVDKTPLYHLIVDQLVATFPDAKYVFLWRNPLSVVASAVALWDTGRWEVNRHPMALFQSIADLTAAWLRYGERSFAIRFEDVVAGGPEDWQRLMAYLELNFEPAQLHHFAEVELRGRKGDPTGTRRYRALSEEPVEKWRQAIHNPVRLAWCRRYLRWIGSERLAVMGYELEQLQRELDAVTTVTDGALADLRTLAVATATDIVRAGVRGNDWGPTVSRRLIAS